MSSRLSLESVRRSNIKAYRDEGKSLPMLRQYLGHYPDGKTPRSKTRSWLKHVHPTEILNNLTNVRTSELDLRALI
jgi:hypothetical protein